MLKIDLKPRFWIKSAFSWRSAPRRIRAISRRPGLGRARPGLGPGQTGTVSQWLFFETVIPNWDQRITK